MGRDVQWASAGGGYVCLDMRLCIRRAAEGNGKGYGVVGEVARRRAADGGSGSGRRDLPLLVTAAVVWPLDDRCAVVCGSSVDIHYLSAVLIDDLIVPEADVDDLPFLICTIISRVLDNARAVVGGSAGDIQKQRAVSIGHIKITIAEGAE